MQIAENVTNFIKINSVCEQLRNQCELDDSYVLTQSQGVPFNGVQISTTDLCMTNQAQYFDGINQYLQFPDNTIGGSVTVQFQAKWLEFRQYSRIFDFGIDAGANNFLFFNELRTPKIFAQSYKTYGESNLTTYSALNLNQWYHFVVVFYLDQIDIYIDGIKITPEDSVTHVNSNGIPKVLRTKNYMGTSNWPGEEDFNGFIDELTMYEYQATDDQIKCMFDDTCQVQYCDICKGSINICKICQENRIGNNCTCPSNYYDENSIALCSQCPFEGCDTCSGNVQCDSCIGSTGQPSSRQTNQCVCPDNYLSKVSIQDECLLCNFKCFNCEQNIDNCTECRGDRILDTNCTCNSHQYDDGSSTNCIECDTTCINCDTNGCLVCEANRIKNMSGTLQEQQECICGTDGINHFTDLGTFYCSSCTEAVITPTISIDYKKIIVQFYIIDIQIPDFISLENIEIDIPEGSSQICEFIFDTEIYDKLGENSKCRLEQSSKQIQIFLGNKPTIMHDLDLLKFKDNTIQRVGCNDNQYLNTYYDNTLLLSSGSLPPTIELQIPTSKVTLCQEVQISITKILNDGFRGLFNFQWSLTSTDSTDTTLIQQILNDQNNNNPENTFLIIPALILQEYKTYEFQLQFQNFAEKIGISTFTIETLSTKGTYAKIQQNQLFIFKNWKQKEFIADINFLDCSSGSNIYIDESLKVDWVDVTTNIDNPISLITYDTQPTEKQIQYVLEKYSLVPGAYKIMLKVNIVTDPLMESTHYVEYEIEESPLTVYIEGGNRLQAYANELVLKGEAKDPDVVPEQQKNNMTYNWLCINMQDTLPCKNIGGELITLGTNQQVNYVKKFFEPYNSFKFTFEADNLTKQNEDSAIIIVVETDLPVLSVNIPETVRNQKINKNDDLQMTITSDQDPDEAFYSLIIIYKYEVVATKSYNYNQFAFQIWDIFSDFNPNEKQFILRVSLYDPQYFMPSQASFTSNINFEPIIGNIIITPTQGTALDTNFQIKCENFYDEDQPLTYKFSFYTQESHYQKEIQQGGKQIQVYKNIIQDFTTQNQIQTVLPSGYQDKLLLLVSVSDSLGAISNVTQSINIVKYSTDYQVNLDKFKEIYQNSLELEQTIKLSQINLMVQEIGQIFLNDDGLGYNNNIQDNIQLQNDYLEFKKTVYDYLLSFIGILSSKIIEDQVMKSINILQNAGGNLLELQDNTQINSQIDKVDGVIEEQSQILQQILNDQLINQGDNKITRKQNSINEILGKSFAFMDQMSQNINEKIQRRRFLTEEDYLQQQKIYNSSKKLKDAIQQTMLPNGDQITFKGENISQEVSVLTPKNLQQKYFDQQQQGLTILTDDQDQNLNQSDTEKGKVYKSSGTGFKQNPFLNDSGFPYKNQNTNVQDIDINVEGEPNDTELQIQKQSISMSFKKSQNSNNNLCIQKKSGEENWDPTSCITQEQENNDLISCKCKDLTPATVVEDLENIFRNSQADEVFSDKGLESLANFHFWETVIFYVYILKLIGITLCIYFGQKKDKQQHQKLIEKKINQIELTENNLENISNNNQDVQQQQQIDEKQYQELDINSNRNQETNNNIISNKQQLIFSQDLLEKQDSLIISQTTNNNNTTKKRKRQKTKKSKYIQNLENNINDNIEDQNSDKKSQQENNITQSLQNSKSLSLKSQNNNENDQILENFPKQDAQQNQDNQVNLDIQNQIIKDLKIQKQIDQENINNIEINKENLNKSQEILKEIDKKNNKFSQKVFNINNDKLNNNLSEKSKPQQNQELTVKKSASEALFSFHTFFGIYLIFDEKLSRPSRYIIYFIRINLLLAITALFSQQMSQFQSLLFSVVASILLAIPCGILSVLLKQQNKIIQLLGIILSFLFFGVALYVVLVTSALMGVDKANEWAISYLSAFCIDTFMFEIMVGYFKVIILKMNIKKNNFIKKSIGDKGILNYLTDQF